VSGLKYVQLIDMYRARYLCVDWLINMSIAEILACSLANFIVSKQTDTWIYNFCNIHKYWEGTIWRFVNVSKQIDVSFSCIYPVIHNEFCHNIVKVVCKTTLLSLPRSTATWTMLWWNPWSITGQMHEKLTYVIHISLHGTFEHKQ